MKNEIVLFWFRRDLRLFDNAGLYHALKSGYAVLPIFIFDKNILNKLPNKKDRRVAFIHNSIEAIDKQLSKLNSNVSVFYDAPLTCFENLKNNYKIKCIYTNHDYEPYAIERDELIKKWCMQNNIAFNSYKDQSIFEKNEVTKDDGRPYTVFTPYANKWKKTLEPFFLKTYPCDKYYKKFIEKNLLIKHNSIPSLQEMGFEKNDEKINQINWDAELIKNYKSNRDIPSINGTSQLSVHLRFGTVSVRQLVNAAWSLSETWVNELIWRDFYFMIIHHFPHSCNNAFKPQYDKIPWRNNEEEFKAWCNGKTGYPIVDAGMRQLNETGFMHNRVRMIVASFLTKHLLIDWRWGERYFAEKLNDFDLSANVGGWQWAASSGCDAAPYFRVFSPYEQTKKFDPKFIYIKKWVPEVDDVNRYPKPIVEHAFARERVLLTYKNALSERH